MKRVVLFTAFSPASGGGGTNIRSLIPEIAKTFHIIRRYTSASAASEIKDGWLGNTIVGAGQQIHFLREAWVKHFCAPRKANDDRTVMSSHHALDASFNQAYTLWRYQPLMKAAVVHLRQIIIGSRRIPGICRLPIHPMQTGVFLAHLPRAVSGARAGLAAKHAADKR